MSERSNTEASNLKVFRNKSIFGRVNRGEIRVGNKGLWVRMDGQIDSCPGIAVSGWTTHVRVKGSARVFMLLLSRIKKGKGEPLPSRSSHFVPEWIEFRLRSFMCSKYHTEKAYNLLSHPPRAEQWKTIQLTTRDGLTSSCWDLGVPFLPSPFLPISIRSAVISRAFLEPKRVAPIESIWSEHLTSITAWPKGAEHETGAAFELLDLCSLVPSLFLSSHPFW